MKRVHCPDQEQLLWLVKLPEGYEWLRINRALAFVQWGAEKWLRDVLETGSVHDWASVQEGSKALMGRASAYLIPAVVSGSQGASRWVVRHYQRGGRVGPILGDRYLRLGTPRPLKELKASVEARARGIHTPAVVAGAIYPSGSFYRADLVTEQVPNVRTLAQVLFGSQETDRIKALILTRHVIKSLDEAQVTHADLNSHNILLPLDQQAEEAHVVDLDRCRISSNAQPKTDKRMWRRLERSLKKLGVESKRPLTELEWATLRMGFQTPL